MRLNKVLYGVMIAGLLSGFLYACSGRNGLPGKVTYAHDVAKIIYDNCTICHRRGGTAHFPLETYTDAYKIFGSIGYTVKERVMPPWPADPNYTHFTHERLLTKQEIDIISKWVAEGAPGGDTAQAPKMPDYPVGSEIRTPDLRILVTPTLLPANQSDKFLLVKVPFELPNDTFASLIEFVPGCHNIAHHVNGDMVKYFFDRKKTVFNGKYVVNMQEDTVGLIKAFEALDLPNDDGTYPVLQKSVVNYLPGVVGQLYPEGIGGYFIPRKGLFLLNDLHYGYTKSTDIIDSSYINVYFSKVPPKRPVLEFQLGTLGVSRVEPDMIIPPNVIKPVKSKFVVPFDISILTINPHMHELGKSFKAYALKPNGDTIRLISIPRWDFNWQYFYTFPKMVKIPKGSTIVAEGVYDNTTDNPINPFNPPQTITDQRGSMRATDEMFQFIITYLEYQPGDENISLETK